MPLKIVTPEVVSEDAQADEERIRILQERIVRAKTDDQAFEDLIKDFEIHLKQTAYRTVGRYIDESDDEWSVVMLAFHEAVQQYEPGKGTFTAFADMVVKRRLIDEIRKQARRRDEISVDMATADDSLMADTTDRRQQRQSDLKLEIDALSEVLAKYDISFSDLAESSPKAGRTRRQCGKVINLLTENKELLAAMRAGGRLPVKRITEHGKIPPKIMERHRKYIIVAVEISLGDYPLLDEYIKRIRLEGRM